MSYDQIKLQASGNHCQTPITRLRYNGPDMFERNGVTTITPSSKPVKLDLAMHLRRENAGLGLRKLELTRELNKLIRQKSGLGNSPGDKWDAIFLERKISSTQQELANVVKQQGELAKKLHNAEVREAVAASKKFPKKITKPTPILELIEKKVASLKKVKFSEMLGKTFKFLLRK